MKTFTTSHGHVISYHQYGRGENTIVCFHGFGQSGEVFEIYSQDLGDQHTIVAIDLFFHGGSIYRSNDPLVHTLWHEIFFEFKCALNIHQFDVIGFSIGSKFAISTFMQYSDQIRYLFLMAPDGLRESRWYRLATFPLVRQFIFKYLMTHPRRLDQLIYLLGRFKIINASTFKFIRTHLRNHEKRIQVYDSWSGFRKMRYKLNVVKSHFAAHPLPIQIVFGNMDHILGIYQLGSTLCKFKNLEAHYVHSNHNSLVLNSKSMIQSILIRT